MNGFQLPYSNSISQNIAVFQEDTVNRSNLEIDSFAHNIVKKAEVPDNYKLKQLNVNTFNPIKKRW